MKKKLFLFYIFLGNILEHHDKALFSLLVPFIGFHFFENSDPTSLLINTYSALFLGLLATPFGALFFGIFADRKGRIKTLSLTITGMSIATLGIGFLPSYKQIGLLSPFFLVVFRALQNFFAAGEKNAAATFIIEQEKGEWKAFFGSLYEATTIIGILLASFELAILSYFDQIHQWPFLFWGAGIFGLMGFFIRSYTFETLSFKKNTNFVELNLFNQWKSLFLIVVGASFSYATYAMSITFFNSFLSLTSKLTIKELTQLNLWLLTLDALMLPIFGWLAVKWKVEKMMLWSSAVMSVLGIPLFYFLSHANYLTILLIRMIIMTSGVCFTSCFRTWAHSLVPENLRCTVLGIGTSAANLLIEGPIVLLALWSYKHTHWTVIPGVLFAGISLLTFIMLYQTRKQPVNLLPAFEVHSSFPRKNFL